MHYDPILFFTAPDNTMANWKGITLPADLVHTAIPRVGYPTHFYDISIFVYRKKWVGTWDGDKIIKKVLF